MGSKSPQIVEVELGRLERALERVEAMLGHDDEDYELLKQLKAGQPQAARPKASQIGPQGSLRH